MTLLTANRILNETDEMTGVEIAIVTVMRELKRRLDAMTATRNLIEFSEELLEDDTLELTAAARERLAQLIGAAKAEVA